MRRFYLASILVLACQGSLTFNGKAVHLTGSDPPPPPQAPPRAAEPAPAPAHDEDSGDDGDDADDAPDDDEPPRAASARFQGEAEPPEAELERLGRACYAHKAAACRELALIYLGHDPEHCGQYQTDDPNGPYVDHGRVHEACKPPTYRHMGTCGVCTTPTISCEKGKGGPFGHHDSKCPAGDLCTSAGYCFPRDEFPVEQHNLKHGELCYLDRECASQDCVITGSTAYGRAGNCY